MKGIVKISATFIFGLSLFGVAFAQTQKISPAPSAFFPVPNTALPVAEPVQPVILPVETPVETPISAPLPSPLPPQEPPSPRSCGVRTVSVLNECGSGAYKNSIAFCSDGAEIAFGSETSCRSVGAWQQYAEAACASRCPAPKKPVLPVKKAPPECSRIPDIRQEYDRLSFDLRTANLDWTSTNEILKRITALKKEQERLEQGGCIAPTPPEIPLSVAEPMRPVVSQPETPIERPLSGPAIEQPAQPTFAASGKEISGYYNAKLEEIISTGTSEKQVRELRELQEETEGLVSQFIKSRKELEASEFDTLAKSIAINPGEIRADAVAVKTVGKKVFVDVGERPVSIEPAVGEVLIRDKDLEVRTNSVTIEGRELSVGGIAVKMAASEVAEKLGLTPKTVELREEGTAAVYDMMVEERRKLFGFIPLNVLRTVVADSRNGDVLRERLSWYGFLTTQ